MSGCKSCIACNKPSDSSLEHNHRIEFRFSKTDFCTTCNELTDHFAEEHNHCSRCDRDLTVRHFPCYKCAGGATGGGCVAPNIKERPGMSFYMSVTCIKCGFTWGDFDDIMYQYEGSSSEEEND